MNCKPNDLALVVRNTSGLDCQDSVIGSPVVVDHLVQHPLGPVWVIKGRMHCRSCGSRFLAFLDADLQPLRPPGVAGSTSAGSPVSSDARVEVLA